MIQLAAFLLLIVVQLEPAQSVQGQVELTVLPSNINASCSIPNDVLQQVRDKVEASLYSLGPQPKPECGEGLWTRVAYLNMSDPIQSCPAAWRDLSANGVRVCGRPEGSVDMCHSTFYNTGHSYSGVCGQVVGYQLGHTDAFHSILTIDQPYVEGVSITYGSPRVHIWTLAADLRENFNGCPCEGGGSPPSFVGTNYYCESGHNGTGNPPSVLYTSDPLWDGAGCESEGSCCSTAPWFTVDLVNPTTDDIEVRICATSGNGEDTPIHFLEIYIQ